MIHDKKPNCGLFLDLDGTLADSLPVMRSVYDRFLAHFNRNGSCEGFEFVNGPPLPQVVSILKQVHQLDGDIDDLVSLYDRMVTAAYTNVKCREGTFELLDTARRNEWKVAVVTSNSRVRTFKWLQEMDLAPMIDFVVGNEDVVNGKPDPEPYMTALAQSSCDAINCIAVEDSLQGALSAHEAGLKTFVISSAGNVSVEWPDGAIAIGRLGEISL